MRRVLGVVGWSGAGKTTLIEQIIPLLTEAGLTVSTIKHAHHGFDMDRPGKDTFRHRVAGAREVLVTSGERWALLHEAPPPPLAVLLDRLAPCDLVLVEGYKSEPGPKLEVFRPLLGKPALWPGRPDIAAVASDGPIEAAGRMVLDLNDPEAVVAWVLQHCAIATGHMASADTTA